MVYNAVPPPPGLYFAHGPSPGGTRGGKSGVAGRPSRERTRDGGTEASSHSHHDDGGKGQRQHSFDRVSASPTAVTPGKSHEPSPGGLLKKPEGVSQNPSQNPPQTPVRSPTPSKLPLPSPGLLPTPPRRGFAPGRVSQPNFSPAVHQGSSAHGASKGFRKGGAGLVSQGLVRPLQASNTYGVAPGSSQPGYHNRAPPTAAPSYSAAQKGSVVHQHDVSSSPLYAGEQHVRSSYQQGGERYFSNSAQKPRGSQTVETHKTGGPRSPLLATPARKIAFSDSQPGVLESGSLSTLGDGLLFSPPRDRGLLISPAPSQYNEPSATPLLQRPRDLFEEIEQSFGMPTSVFDTAFLSGTNPQTPNVKTPGFKAHTLLQTPGFKAQTLLQTPGFKAQTLLQTPAAKRPPLHGAPSPALLPTPSKLSGDSFLTPVKQAQDAAAAAWALVSGTPGILPSPARLGTNQKAPAVTSSPARAPYPEHWRPEEISQGVKRGELFRAVLRVNAFRRTEAYVTIEGVSTDVLIDGLIAQNRAIEGDTVYVKVDPPSKWPFLKGAKADDTASEASSASGLSSVMEKLNLGTTRGGMFGLEDSGDDQSEQGSLGAESSLAGSLENRHNGFGFTSKSEAGSANGRSGSEGMSNGMGSLKEEATDGPDDVQRQLDGLLRQLAGGSNEHGRKGGSVGSLETEDGSAFGSFGGRSVGSVTKAGSELERGEEQDAYNDTESLSEGDLYSVESSELEERRGSPSERAVEKLAAQLKAAPNRRPTGFVVGIAEFSSRREALVGYLQIPTRSSKFSNTPAKPSSDTPVRGLFQDNINGSPIVTPFTSPSITLMPADPRMPKMTVWVDGLPDGLKERVREGDPNVGTTLVAARMDCWKAQHYQPLAVVRQSLGQAGEIETETAAIMFMHKIHGPDFPPEALECLPPTPWGIPLDELARRRDLRAERIFTIDPPTARDLDDAVSVKRLGNGNFEIGVHIADVSFFVKPGTELDKEARRRSTSVYLIQRVLPMLPPLLCEQLCSLNPGVDRLAFSVVWELTPSGEIIRQWMGRTVITSCCKIAYGHAQAMIENRFDPDNFLAGPQTGPKPPTLHGAHSWDDVTADVIALNGLAKALRASRFEGGALRLDNTKVTFKLDADGNPDGVAVYESLEANRLIEEFMLLANQSVAGAISRAFPEAALLRRHPPPNERKLEEFAKLCEAHGLEVNLASAGSLHASLEQIRAETAHDGAIAEVIRLGATKPMNLAKYFCTGELLGAPEDWGHYALAMPLYTHFTSPIRRYPDLVVHRTLAAALEAEQNMRELHSRGIQFARVESLQSDGPADESKPFTGPVRGDVKEALLTWHAALWDDEKGDRGVEKRAVAVAGKAHGVPENVELQGVATYCNERKMASKQAQEASDKVFLCVLLKRRGGMVSDARVVSLGPKWATVYVCRFGLERRIYFEDLQGAQAEFFESTRTVVISEARESGRSTKKAARKAIAVEEYGDPLAEEAAELGIEAAVLPTTLRMLSSVPVVCYAITGNNRPMDVGVRLYL